MTVLPLVAPPPPPSVRDFDALPETWRSGPRRCVVLLPVSFSRCAPLTPLVTKTGRVISVIFSGLRGFSCNGGRGAHLRFSCNNPPSLCSTQGLCFGPSISQPTKTWCAVCVHCARDPSGPPRRGLHGTCTASPRPPIACPRPLSFSSSGPSSSAQRVNGPNLQPVYYNSPPGSVRARKSSQHGGLAHADSALYPSPPGPARAAFMSTPGSPLPGRRSFSGSPSGPSGAVSGARDSHRSDHSVPPLWALMSGVRQDGTLFATHGWLAVGQKEGWDYQAVCRTLCELQDDLGLLPKLTTGIHHVLKALEPQFCAECGTTRSGLQRTLFCVGLPDGSAMLQVMRGRVAVAGRERGRPRQKAGLTVHECGIVTNPPC